jgi:MFS family permease
MLLVAFLVNFATGFVQFGYSLTLPSMEEALHISHTEAGLLITLMAATRIGGSFVSGTLAPRYGSRSMTAGGTLAVGASMVLLGFAQNYVMALGAAVLMGIGGGVALTPIMGLLAAWFRLRDRGLAAGLAASGGSVSFIVAGVAVPILTGANWDDGWRHSWQLFGAMVLGIGVVSVLFVRESPSEPLESERRPDRRRSSWPIEAFKHPAVWLITLLAFTSGWSQNLFTTFFGLYLTQENDVSLAVAGQLVIMMGALSIGSGVAWGWMSDKLGRGQAFAYSFAVQGAAFVLLAVAPVFVSFLVASALMGITLRAAYTICAASSGDYVPVRFSAAAFALMSVGAGLGSTVSPTIGGLMADYVDMKWVFWMATGGSVVGLLGALYLQSRRRADAPQ